MAKLKNFSKSLFILVLFYLPTLAFSQDPIWAKNDGGTGNSSSFKAAIDKKGNIYTLGNFSGTIFKDAFQLVSASNDMFISKYNKQGDLKWTKKVGGPSNDSGSGLALSNDSANIIITGSFQGSCDFGGISKTSSGDRDIFIAKYDTLGVINWVQVIGTGLSLQNSMDLGVDRDNNILICGVFNDSINILSHKYTSNGFTTNFAAKFNPNGDYLWSKVFYGKNSTSRIYSLAIAGNDYYFAGYYKDSIYIGNNKLYSNPTYFDAILFKTDANGNTQWVRELKGNLDDFLTSISIDSNGNIYSGGYTKSTILSVDSTETIKSDQLHQAHGGNDICFFKYSSNGNLNWWHSAGGAGDDKLFRSLANKNTFIVTGQFEQQFTFNNKSFSSNGNADVFTLIYDQNNNLIYGNQFGGTALDVGQTSVIDKQGNYSVIGDFYSPSININNTILTNTNSANRDVFIVSYDKASLLKTITPITCNSSATGEISLTPEGTVVPPFTYQWSKKEGGFSSSLQTITGLTAGTYRVTFTDAVGYQKRDSVVLTEPPALSVSERIHTDATCYNSTNGVLKPRITGGTGARTFLWSGNGTGIKATDSIQTALSAGTYNLTVTDANGCSKPLNNMVITQPGKINFNNTVVTKINGVQGAVDLSIQGGTPAFTYAWSGPSGFTATTQNIGNILVVGDYTVNVTDQNLCTADTTVLIPNSLVFYAYVSDKQHVKCKTGSTGSISIALENLPTLNTATYEWTKDGSAIAADEATISGLAIGTYAVTVTAVPNGTAFTVNNIKINEPATSLGVTLTPNNITCFGVIDGFIDANPTGGTLPYTYQWTKDGGAFPSVSEVISGLSKANYSVTVSDANNCTQVAGASITEPSVISINSAIVTGVTCTGTKNDGAISLNVTGGTGAYGFRWSNGLTTQNISLLSAGTYRCTITDVNKCVTSTQQTVGQPSPIVASFNNTNISCFGGSDGAINLTPSGGNAGGYTFLWENGSNLEDRSLLAAATYTVTVTDSKSCEKTFATNLIEPSDLTLGVSSIQNVNCNGAANGNISLSTSGGTLPYIWVWSNNKTGSVATNLSPGNYSVTVTDGKNCTKPASFVITEPTPLVISETLASHKDITCNGASTGELEVIASGSTGTYEFSLDGTIWQSAGLFNSVSSGSYAVQVRDQSVTSCFKTVSPSIAITQPAAIVFSLPTVTPITCFGLTNGSLNTPASGGTGTLSYALKLNGSVSSNTSGASTGLFTSLAASTGYTVEVTDAAGCGPVASSSLNVIEPAQLSFSNPTITDITCFGLTNGSINAPGTGGTGTLVYTMKLNSIVSTNTSGEALGAYSGLGAGTNYTIEVTDANNCGPVATSNIAIAEPQVISIISDTAYKTTSVGASDGSLSVIASGGTGNLSYSLNGLSQSTGTFTNLPKGSYTVNVTDANLCGPVNSSVLKVDEPNTAVDLIAGGFIRLFPNPVSDIAFITANNANVSSLNLVLRSITGKDVIIRKYENIGNDFKESIDVSQLPKGVYIVILNGTVLKDKLIIQ